MKNFLIAFSGIIIISAIAQAIAPWWIIAVVAFGVSYGVSQKAFTAFLSGFLAVFVLWVAYAFWLSHGNNDVLAKKVAQLLPFKGHVSFLLLATGIIGGLVSGLGALSGRWFAEAQK